MGQHDLSYKLFFAHRRMIQDLLRDIVGERWVDLIDLDSGEQVNASFVSPRHQSRESDIIWKFRRKDGGAPVYVYIPYSREELAALSSPVAELFRIEKSHDWSEIRSSVHRLRRTIPPTEDSLRRAFETWLQKVILPRLGLPEEKAEETPTLEEFETMLAESIDRWNRELREEGVQEGLQRGEARMLLRQLQMKFGPLASEIEERVRSADADSLLEWGARVLSAEHLADVFKS